MRSVTRITKCVTIRTRRVALSARCTEYCFARSRQKGGGGGRGDKPMRRGTCYRIPGIEPPPASELEKQSQGCPHKLLLKNFIPFPWFLDKMIFRKERTINVRTNYLLKASLWLHILKNTKKMFRMKVKIPNKYIKYKINYDIYNK